MRWVTIVLHSFLTHWYLTTDSVHSSDPARPCSTLTTLCQTWLYCDHQWNTDSDRVWLSVHMNNFPFTVHCEHCTVLYNMIQTIGQEHVIRICHNMYCRSCMISWDWFIEIFPPLTTDHCVVPESWWCQLCWPHPGSRLITGTVHHQVLHQHSILFRSNIFEATSHLDCTTSTHTLLSIMHWKLCWVWVMLVLWQLIAG